MNQSLLNFLSQISTEEQQILDGDTTIQKNIYTSSDDFVIDSRKMLSLGQLIDVRQHTRFVHFPKHSHNYIEIIYMCSGSTIHLINERTSIHLQTGEFLFLNQNISQEIMPASLEDVAVNFCILPEFFDRILPYMTGESPLRNFLIGSFKHANSDVDYLHFQTANVLPIQNLAENMIWELIHNNHDNRNIIQSTMGLLFLQLLDHTDKMNQSIPQHFEQNQFFTCLKYINDHYTSATLSDLSELLNQPTYYISKLIKKYSGETFKSILQKKRLSESLYLLEHTSIGVEEIITIVGYDNSSYFHRIFKSNYKMTPREYRLANTLK